MNIQKGIVRYRYGKREYTLSFRPGSPARSMGMEIESELIQLDHGWRATLKLLPQGPVEIKEAFLEANYRFTQDDRIFCNGFQSWTESREFSSNERIRKLARSAKRFNVHCFGDYHFYPYTGDRGDLHSYVYCYIRQKTGDVTLLGSLNEDTGYTICACEARKNRIRIMKDAEGLAVAEPYLIMDVMILQGPEREVISYYFESLCPGLETKEPATGWTSWYNYYTNISESIIMDNLNVLSRNRIPIDIFQIDDGYQAAVGDWLEVKASFPGGMKQIAGAIREKGYRAGLWLAPFICEEKSGMMKSHGDWILKDKGEPVAAGWNPNWSGNFYALDVYNDEFRYHIKEVFDTVLNQWGFDMVKLDFLYAAAMTPRDGMTRGSIMADAMKFLRRCCGERIILGCGVPLGTAFGQVDYCRIGSDVSPKWEDRLLSAIHYRERVSTRNSITSTIGRSHLDGRVFVNDPDVVILRDENNTMTGEERQTLFLINNIFGGLLFTSDSISGYTPEILRQYRSLFPFRKKENIVQSWSGEVLKTTFTIGDNTYLFYANLSTSRAKVTLDEGLYFCDDPVEENRFIAGGDEILLRAHESRCYLLVREEFFTVSGTTAHCFPGSEIVSCVQKGDAITVTQHEHVRNGNTVYIRTPNAGQFFINGNPIQSQKIRDKFFILKTELKTVEGP